MLPLSLFSAPVESVESLEHALSEPSEALIESIARLDGDLIILGAGGKMGPSMGRMARKAFDLAGSGGRVVAVSRFTNASVAASLQEHHVEVLQGDLSDGGFLDSLPDARNVLYVVGMKFGSAGALAQTWASNVYLAGTVANRFPSSRIVALSTGNVYGLSSATGLGSSETESPSPIGEYAMSALGRKRVFEHFSRSLGTPMAIVRLNYATELRYGVLVDLAQSVFRGDNVPLEMGYFNVIWQRDACDFILRCFEHVSVPPLLLNITGADRLSTRDVCERFGKILGRTPRYTGAEGPTALLSDARQAIGLFGSPLAGLDEMIAMTAEWVRRGGETWNKPTHFQTRDGKF